MREHRKSKITNLGETYKFMVYLKREDLRSLLERKRSSVPDTWPLDQILEDEIRTQYGHKCVNDFEDTT